jgi:hypothetical protein
VSHKGRRIVLEAQSNRASKANTPRQKSKGERKEKAENKGNKGGNNGKTLNRILRQQKWG